METFEVCVSPFQVDVSSKTNRTSFGRTGKEVQKRDRSLYTSRSDRTEGPRTLVRTEEGGKEGGLENLRRPLMSTHRREINMIVPKSSEGVRFSKVLQTFYK